MSEVDEVESVSGSESQSVRSSTTSLSSDRLSDRGRRRKVKRKAGLELPQLVPKKTQLTASLPDYNTSRNKSGKSNNIYIYLSLLFVSPFFSSKSYNIVNNFFSVIMYVLFIYL